MPKLIEGLQDRILLAARKRLLEGDLSSFSLRRIAGDCGIAVGTIYNYYKDKESLLGAVMARDWLKALAKTEEEIRGAQTFNEGVRSILRSIRSFSSNYEWIWQSYTTGAGFGAHYRKRHDLLVSQVCHELELLYDKFGQAESENRVILLAELIIAAGRHPEIPEEEAASFMGIGPEK